MNTEAEYSIEELLAGAGFDGLGEDPSPEAIRLCVERLWDRISAEDVGQKSLIREEAVKRLRRAGVRSAASVYDNLIKSMVDSSEEQQSDGGTIAPGVVDLVEEGGQTLFVLEGGEVVEAAEGVSAWAIKSLPWAPVPTAQSVHKALKTTATAEPVRDGRFDDLRKLIMEKVILPKPEKSWASLLAAWVFGTYLIPQFRYFPLLLLEGPPERGKTRLGKVLIFTAFRGVYTPSPTPAVLFRDREYHRVSLLLDIEDLPNALGRSDLNDLILNSFERDGSVRRTTRPDAEPQNQIEHFRVYGPTILITNRPVADHSPLRSRCIRVPMPEAGDQQVPDAASPDDLMQIRASIIAWVALHSGQQLPTVEVPFTGRLKDLATPILRVLKLVAPEEVEGVIALLRDLDADRKVEASGSWEARLATAIWKARHLVSDGRLYYKQLLSFVNEGFDENGHLNTTQIGFARRKLGLHSDRGGSGGGTYLHYPGDEEARRLFERYSPSGSEGSGGSGSEQSQGLSALNHPLNHAREGFSPQTPHEDWGTEPPEPSEPLPGPIEEDDFEEFLL